MIGQYTVGVINKLTNNLFLFFWEFDNVNYNDVLYNAKIISVKGNIDIDILKSSNPDNYHLVSFDIISADKCKRLQRLITIEGDYSGLDDEDLFFSRNAGFNVLRIGKKIDKDSPVFMERVSGNLAMYNYKSVKHFALYKKYCNVPNFCEKTLWANLPAKLIVYKTRFHK